MDKIYILSLTILYPDSSRSRMVIGYYNDLELLKEAESWVADYIFMNIKSSIVDLNYEEIPINKISRLPSNPKVFDRDRVSRAMEKARNDEMKRIEEENIIWDERFRKRFESERDRGYE